MQNSVRRGAVAISGGVRAATGHGRRIRKREVAKFDFAFDLLFSGYRRCAVIDLRLRRENVIQTGPWTPRHAEKYW